MIAKLLVTVALATLGLAAPEAEGLEKRQTLAQVFTRCTVPNTAALTFVGSDSFTIGPNP